MADSIEKLILCDFDGTISPLSLSDYLYGKFASCGMKYSDLWAQGKISTREEVQKSFQYIQASKEEMEEALSVVPIVAGFEDFFAFCGRHALRLIVVSDGLEWAIRYVLAKAGVEDIRVMSNQIFFEGNKFSFRFPYFTSDAPHAGVDKLKIVRQFSKQGRRIYLIGDGRTDFPASHAVDFVFARDELWDYCQKHQIPSFQFADFHDIQAYLNDLEKDL